MALSLVSAGAAWWKTVSSAASNSERHSAVCQAGNNGQVLNGWKRRSVTNQIFLLVSLHASFLNALLLELLCDGHEYVSVLWHTLCQFANKNFRFSRFFRLQ